MGQKPPAAGDKLKDILPFDPYQNGGRIPGTNPPRNYVWKDKYNVVTRGDLMRLVGWMPLDGRGNENPTLSDPLKALDVQDMQALTEMLGHFNGMKYAGVYFCCTCT
ncbi:hypothetical protein DNFV4_00862 [Nitrospira tepida]|uniref:Uncharacterized protein n=1 Tax=Nitrospira tepida TaxID=2973512 RepID=A0AA86MWJ6_9BACT|nr:hypothetical protein [Nitrospira tepida]CAI4030434.1 hypothetical protein DNFV4_00862 [Nitrospira tepida]